MEIFARDERRSSSVRFPYGAMRANIEINENL